MVYALYLAFTKHGQFVAFDNFVKKLAGLEEELERMRSTRE